MIMSRDEALRRLEYATRRIETIGWVQGASRTPATPTDPYETGPGCLMGSLTTDGEFGVFRSLQQAQAELGTAYIPSLEASRSALSDTWQVFSRRFYYALGKSAVAWNDAPERTKDEVLTFLKTQREEIYAMTAEEWTAEQTGEPQKTLDNEPKF